MKGLEGIDNDRNIKLWKRVEDFYELSKKGDEEDGEEEIEEESIFTKTFNTFSVKNVIQVSKKKVANLKDDDHNKEDEINIVDSFEKLSTESESIVNFHNFEVMFAKLLWYTTKIDINIEGFQQNGMSDNYITLANQ